MKMRLVRIFPFLLLPFALFGQNLALMVDLQLDRASATVAGDAGKTERLVGSEKMIRGAELRINANYDKKHMGDRGTPPLEDYLSSSAEAFFEADPDLVTGTLFLKGVETFQLIFTPTIRVWALAGDKWITVQSERWSPTFSTAETSIDIRIEGIAGSVVTNDTVLEVHARSGDGLAAVDRVAITVVKIEFMLSFDDGPVVPQTQTTLESLRKIYVGGQHVRTVFFMVGKGGSRARFFDIWASRLTGVASHPELVRAVFNAGHYVGNHTAHHAGFTETWTEESVFSEILEAEIDIGTALGGAIAGAMPKLFRPPYLQNLPIISAGVQKTGYTLIWGKANLGESNPFLKYADIKRRSREHLESWNTREDPTRKNLPSVLIYHELHNDIADNIQEIVAILRNSGFVLRHFDPLLCYPNKADY